jgi:hypothetical protein
MNITCFNDGNVWSPNGVEIAAAKLRFALGFPEETFICPKCHKPNKISKADFQMALNAPAAAAPAPKPAGPAAPAPVNAPGQGWLAGHTMTVPAGPMAGPALATAKSGTVLARSLRVRKGHSKADPVVAGLVKGQKITVQATWTDGKDTWAQLGPDQWAAVVYNGEALIDLD